MTLGGRAVVDSARASDVSISASLPMLQIVAKRLTVRSGLAARNLLPSGPSKLRRRQGSRYSFATLLFFSLFESCWMVSYFRTCSLTTRQLCNATRLSLARFTLKTFNLDPLRSINIGRLNHPFGHFDVRSLAARELQLFTE